MQSSGIPKARTLGELKRIPDFDARTISRSVKNEMRQNLLRMIEKNEPLFPGVHGYEDTVRSRSACTVPVAAEMKRVFRQRARGLRDEHRVAGRVEED